MQLTGFSHTKTVMAAFYLNNRGTKHEPKVYNNNTLLLFCQTPSYLWVKLDRLLTFCHHLVALCKKNIFIHYTAEETFRLWMGCWCQNTAHIYHIFGLLNSWVLHTSLVLQHSHSPHRQCPE